MTSKFAVTVAVGSTIAVLAFAGGFYHVGKSTVPRTNESTPAGSPQPAKPAQPPRMTAPPAYGVPAPVEVRLTSADDQQYPLCNYNLSDGIVTKEPVNRPCRHIKLPKVKPVTEAPPGAPPLPDDADPFALAQYYAAVQAAGMNEAEQAAFRMYLRQQAKARIRHLEAMTYGLQVVETEEDRVDVLADGWDGFTAADNTADEELYAMLDATRYEALVRKIGVTTVPLALALYGRGGQ